MVEPVNFGRLQDALFNPWGKFEMFNSVVCVTLETVSFLSIKLGKRMKTMKIGKSKNMQKKFITNF